MRSLAEDARGHNHLPGFIQVHVFFFQKRVLGGNGSNDHAELKSENGFVKQNKKLVHECGFRFSVRASEQAKQKNLFLGIWAKLNSLDLGGEVQYCP